MSSNKWTSLLIVALLLILGVTVDAQYARKRPNDAMPVVRVFTPSHRGSIGATVAAQTIGGSAYDVTAVTSVTWTCDNCSVTSGTATGTNTWSQNVTLGEGSNTICVTAHDGDGNSSSEVCFIFGLDTGVPPNDTTPPVVDITAPTTASTYNTTTTANTVSGTASDNVAVTQIIANGACVSGGSQNLTPATTWSVNVTIAVDTTCVVTVTAYDMAQNSGSDNISITNTGGTLSVTSNVIPSGRVAVAYSYTLNASGGVPPYTWAESGTGLSTDPECGGLTLSSAGVVSGTPTTAGLCQFSVEVTDSTSPTPLTDIGAIELTILPASAGGGNDFFDALQPSAYQAISFRTQNEIDAYTMGNPSRPNPDDWITSPYVTYDQACDCARIHIPENYNVPPNRGLSDVYIPFFPTEPIAGDVWWVIIDFRYRENQCAAVDTVGSDWNSNHSMKGYMFLGGDGTVASVGGDGILGTHFNFKIDTTVTRPELGWNSYQFANVSFKGANMDRIEPVRPNDNRARKAVCGEWYRLYYRWTVTAPVTDPVSPWSVFIATESLPAAVTIDELLTRMPWCATCTEVNPTGHGFTRIQFYYQPKPGRSLDGVCNTPDTCPAVDMDFRNFLVLKNVTPSLESPVP